MPARRSTPSTLWLVKDDPQRSWWCTCKQGICEAPYYHNRRTMPSGGTGWLFVCALCDRAFMFARARRIRLSLREIAEHSAPKERTVHSSRGETREVLLATAADWLAHAEPIAAQLEEGERYVFFDGRVLPARHGPVRFQGLWRAHDLSDLPHISGAPLGELLSEPGYWQPSVDDNDR